MADAIDVSRLTDGVMLSPEVSSAIHAATLENSAIQSLARKIEMPAQGLTWQTITGEPEAAWVSETEEKPVSRPTFGSDEVAPYKMAVIVPFSDEFKRDKARLFAEVQRRIPYALGRLFDRTVLGLVDAPGEHFDQLSEVPEVEYDGTNADSAYDSLLDVDAAISDAGYVLDGWALAPSARNRLMRVRVDGSPLFTTGVQSGDVFSNLLGGRVEYRKALGEVPNLMGIAGDWTAAEWGTVEGVKLSASTESTLTETVDDGNGGTTTRTLNLWQRNMFALRAEVEVAFRADADAFARLVTELSEPDAGAGGGDE